MKTFKLFALLILVGLVAASCKKTNVDPEDTAQQKFAQALVGTWSATQIRKDNETITSEYPNFKIAFTANTANAENISGNITASGDNFDANTRVLGSGTWTFKGTGTGTLDLNVSANVDEMTASLNAENTTLTVTFTVSSPAARAAGLVGNYNIVLNKD